MAWISAPMETSLEPFTADRGFSRDEPISPFAVEFFRGSWDKQATPAGATNTDRRLTHNPAVPEP